MTTFLSWVTHLDPARRRALLEHRRDAAASDDDDRELARVLSSATSVRLLAPRLSLAQLQILEALLGLGRRATVRSLVTLLAAADGAAAEHEQHVVSVLAQLYERGLAWPAGPVPDRVSAAPE